MFRRLIIAGISLLMFFSFYQNADTAFAAPLKGEFQDDYYKDWPLFHFYPAADVPRFSISRFGPVGLSLDLMQPAFTMHITAVEPGSPADATGKLKKGQIIESINGKVLKDVDPRVILGNLITEAEAKDGILKMMVKDDAKASAQEVIVKIPVLGAYSDTWPMDCPKSEKIVRNFSDFLAKHPRGWGSALFLLSTGEEKDLDVVRGWFSGKLPENMRGIPWSIGYEGPAICEYYLRTGDKTVLPAIKSMTEYLKETIYNGSWMGRGGCNYGYMAGGHMNAAGVHDLTFLLLAKECGVDVDEHTLQSCLYHFYRYAGHWNVSYGDGLPEGGGVDNGKNGGLAFAMAAAASLSPAGEDSVYAKARDISANKSFYTTSWLFHGHTGGGIGELWRGAAAGLLAEKRPEMYRSFMNERRWMYELARTYDGAFGWASGMNVGYGTTGHNGGKSWGNYIPLVFTIPRKNLRIYGAPPTKYSKQYKIPERPWGTKADEAFYSLEPGEYKPGKKEDMTQERLPTHASWPLLRRLGDPEVSDDELLMFAHHPDSTGHGTAAGSIASNQRDHLLVELLKSKDPRARWAGVRAVSGAQKGVTASDERLTDEVIELLGGMITDPEESWWVVMEALKTLGLAPAEKIAPYSDRIAYWMKHEDWWLRHAALIAVKPIATDKRFYKELLPIIGDMVVNNTRAVALGPLRDIVSAMQDADKEVQEFAVGVLARAYNKYPTTFNAPGGQDMSNCADYMLKGLARNVANAPGGFDALYEVSKKRFPEAALPHKDLYMGADSSKFGPTVREALKPLVLETLIPQYIGAYNHIASNSELLLKEAASEKMAANYYYREPRMKGLVDLYNRMGIHDYDWKGFGPEMTKIKWDYLTFDPPEKKLWEPGWRYRKVTYPSGMENWFKPEFDAKASGWKEGFAPFGQLDGKLVTEHGDCSQSYCRCGEPMQTLWEKEVLIMRTKIKLPPFKENHIYRLCVGGMSHVHAGDGFIVYINGKQFMQRDRGVGKREGGKPVCNYITKDMWPTFEKEVTIAATSFLPIPGGKRSPGVQKNHFSIILQEMKAPPITEEVILKGKTLQPLASSEWQATLEDEDKYRYDETHVANKDVLGKWRCVAEVASVAEFDPAGEAAPLKDIPIKQIELKKDGHTDDELMIWSGDVLMDLHRYEALKMQVEDLDGQNYLFIEKGGFDKKKPTDWKTPWLVMKSL